MSSKQHAFNEIACNEIDNKKQSLINLSKYIWENPELAYKEFKAHDTLVEYLRQSNFTVHEKHGLETAFRADFSSGQNGITIGILCEYDALPNLGHACGHNLIAMAGVGAATGVKAVIEAGHLQHNKLIGKVSVIGCPAEEGAGGKIDLIKAGIFKDIDVAMMVHPGSRNSPSAIVLAIDRVTITYKGKASHADITSWESQNALDAAVLCYQSIACLRHRLPTDCRISGVITKGGVSPRIIPEEAILEVTIRAQTKGTLTQLRTRLIVCCEAAAQATGCTVSLQWTAKPYENLLSNSIIEEIYSRNLINLGIEICTDEAKLQMPAGSTDMGNVSHIIPSIQPIFDINASGVVHSRPFRTAAGEPFAMNAAIGQAKALALTAVEIFLQPEFIHSIMAKFEDDLIQDSKV